MGKEVKNVEESYKKVKFADGWAFVNSYGERINKKGYYFIYDFYEGIAVVYDGKKFGTIGTDGNEIIPCKYDFIGSYHNGVAYSCLNNEYNYIDREGNITILEAIKTRKRVFV